MWETLTNENILRVLEKQYSYIVWHSAKETRNG